MITIESCALKTLNYYDQCYDCDGKAKHVCYTTRYALKEHLQTFKQLFDLDSERLEDKFEDMFEIHSGGFI